MKQTKTPDALVECIINSSSPRPDEEDFWAIMVMLAAQDRPIFAISGSLRGSAEYVAKLIGRNQIRLKVGQQHKILVFQGEKARWAMAKIGKVPGISTLSFVTGGVSEITRVLSGAEPALPNIALDEEYVNLC